METLRESGKWDQEGDVDAGAHRPGMPEYRERVSNSQISAMQPGQKPNNPLFQAYGGSYANAYEAALHFEEIKPVPDESSGDVAGEVPSVLITMGEPPFQLGILRPEASEDEAERHMNRVAGNAAEMSAYYKRRPAEKMIRFLLLFLGAEVILAAGLYFSGIL